MSKIGVGRLRLESQKPCCQDGTCKQVEQEKTVVWCSKKRHAGVTDQIGMGTCTMHVIERKEIIWCYKQRA